MRYGVIAENPLERVGLAAGLVPTPRIDGYAAAFSRAIMVATRLGIFDALTAPEIAIRSAPMGLARCAASPTGLRPRLP
jgi:hypothetical protein